jgi:CubicO group peptidase (beta-lactamase class C family)
MNRTLDILRQGITEGLHLGAQIYVSVDDQPVLDDAVGEACFGVPMTRDSINWWLSAVKPITAVAIAQLWERDKLELDDRVGQHIPEFARGGKEAITIRHLLTHTGGFRGVSSNSSPEPWDQIIQTICAARIEPGWTPGEKAGYHIASSWFILAEIVRRLDGRMIDRYAREEISLPLGMTDCWIGLPPDKFREYGDRIASTYSTEKHRPDPNHARLTPEFAALVRPAANGRGPMRQLARFYEMMMRHGVLPPLSPGEGTTARQEPGPPARNRLLLPQSVEAMTARHRAGMLDHTFKHIIDFGLGFLINSAQYGAETVPYGYGRYASRRTFGHSGNQTSCAFCDPERKLVAAWVCNGTPGEARHQQRQRAINDAIYEDLNFAG